METERLLVRAYDVFKTLNDLSPRTYKNKKQSTVIHNDPQRSKRLTTIQKIHNHLQRPTTTSKNVHSDSQRLTTIQIHHNNPQRLKMILKNVHNYPLRLTKIILKKLKRLFMTQNNLQQSTTTK